MTASIRMLSVPQGVELVEWLARSAGAAGSAWVQAVGRVESVELGAADGSTRTLTGPLALASLSGPAAGPHGVVLARNTDTGLETLGGLLVRARVLGVTVTVMPCGEAGAPLLALAGGSTASATEARSGALAAGAALGTEGGGWGAVASSAAGSAAEEEEPAPEPGDLVQHFAFGLCEVLMSDGETLKIRDVRGTGRVREIRVDVLDVSSPSLRNGKRLFKLTRRA